MILIFIVAGIPAFIPVVLPVRDETLILTSIVTTSTIKHPSITATVQLIGCIPPTLPFEAEECPDPETPSTPTPTPTPPAVT